jgi:zinc transporter ZupT
VYVQGLLSCLNSFSGAVFLIVGLTHLLPHVAEYEAKANLDTDYPVGLAIVALGFILVLFVEQILFNVHGHMPEKPEDDDQRLQDIPLLERTKGLARFYQEPLITELAVGLHGVLECITMGLAVCHALHSVFAHSVCVHVPRTNDPWFACL